MLRRRPLPLQELPSTSTPVSLRSTTTIATTCLVGMILLLVVSMKSSAAFAPSRVSIISSHTALPFYHSPPPLLSRTKVWVATTSSPPTEEPPPQQQQQQQLVDDEYLTALQQFAAAAAAATTNNSTATSTKSKKEQTNTASSSWRDDGFIFGLTEDLQRPSGKQALIVVEGDSMETQPYQVALVSITLLNHLYYIVTSMIELYHANHNHHHIIITNNIMDGSGSGMAALLITTGQLLVVSLLSWISADFGSGVLHWSVDNYGNGRTPIMGNIIAAFQGHHTAPWTITQRSFFNNVYKLCLPFGILPVTILAYVTGPIGTYFLTSFCVLEILSQEFHKWSHQMKSETPWIGNLLQKHHLSIGRVPHTKHHTLPFETNYCIISGICNPVLDQYGFFRRLEHVIYQRNGIESNAWKLDPILRERTLNGIYTPPEVE